MPTIVTRVAAITGYSEEDLLLLWNDCVEQVTGNEQEEQNLFSFSKAAHLFLEEAGVLLSVDKVKSVNVKNATTSD